MDEDNLLPFSLPAVCRKKMIVAFDGGRLSSDGGVRLLCDVERQLDLAERLAGCMWDPLRPKNIDDAAKRIVMDHLPHQGRQALGTFAEVYRLRRRHHQDRTAGADHRLAFKARMTAATVDSSLPGSASLRSPERTPAFQPGACRASVDAE